MLKQILDLLALDEHYGQSEAIEIAKGKYKIPTTFKEGFNKIKREIKWLKRKQ
jgi:hypothetical protein